MVTTQIQLSLSVHNEDNEKAQPLSAEVTVKNIGRRPELEVSLHRILDADGTVVKAHLSFQSPSTNLVPLLLRPQVRQCLSNSRRQL